MLVSRCNCGFRDATTQLNRGDFATRAEQLGAIERKLYEAFIDAVVTELARPKSFAAASA